MSCYNWEQGTVRIPTAEWGKMKKEFRNQFNKKVEVLQRKANTIYERMMLESKHKRGYNFRDRCWDLIHGNGIGDSESYYVFHSMFPSGKKNKRPFVPQKKAFPVARNNMLQFHQDELHVRFCEQSKTVYYTCDENNRSVDRCADSLLGQSILYALNRVVYGRGSGGKFVGNDEYNREDSCEGGGGNYVTRRFGPLGSK